MYKKTLLLLAGVAAVVTMGAGCASRVADNPTSTAEAFVSGDWKTYQDKTYGYQFDYPQSWNLVGKSNTDPTAYNVTIWEGDGVNKANIQIVKVIYGTNADGTVSNRESYLKMLANDGSSKTVISGGVGYYSINETKGGLQPMIYLVGAKEIFLMSFNIDLTKTPLVEAEKFFKQIIGSFTFTGAIVDINATQKVSYYLPKDITQYFRDAFPYTSGGTETALAASKVVYIKYTTTTDPIADPMRTAVQAAIELIPAGGGPPHANVAYLKIVGSSAYVMLDIDFDGWAGSGAFIEEIHPIIIKNLLQFPAIKNVVFGPAPGDTKEQIEKTVQPTTPATNNAVTQPVVKSNKPVIIYPANGSTVDGVTIKGTAKPNSQIWAYPKNELACISINTYAGGGGSTVDSKGNFEFALAEPCSKNLTVVVSTEDPAADKTGACRSSENISEAITFTNSGKLPGICNQ